MGKRAQSHPFENNPFVGGFPDEMDSAQGERYLEVSDTLAELLEDVQLDAQHRQFIWPDNKRLSLEQSVRHIRKQYPRFPAYTTADALISWVEQGYVPKGHSPEQLAELDRLTEQWVDDYDGQRAARCRRE
jgi:hypothetical protein